MDDGASQYVKFMIGMQKTKLRDPWLHWEVAFKMSPYINFAAKSELQNVPNHHVLFRKQTYGDCGFLYHFDYNKWIERRLTAQLPADDLLTTMRKPTSLDQFANSLTLGIRGTFLHSQNYHKVVSIYTLYYKSHQENFKLSSLFEVPFLRNLLAHYGDLNLRADIGPILDSLVWQIIRVGTCLQRFQQPIEHIVGNLTRPLTKMFRRKKLDNQAQNRNTEEALTTVSETETGKDSIDKEFQVDLTTAARLSFDLNLRRFTDADLMTQLHFARSETTLKFLLQLTPIFDTLYLPADQAKYGELCTSLKWKLLEQSFVTLKLNMNDGTYLRGVPGYEADLQGTNAEKVNKWLQRRVKVGLQFDL